MECSHRSVASMRTSDHEVVNGEFAVTGSGSRGGVGCGGGRLAGAAAGWWQPSAGGAGAQRKKKKNAGSWGSGKPQTRTARHRQNQSKCKP